MTLRRPSEARVCLRRSVSRTATGRRSCSAASCHRVLPMLATITAYGVGLFIHVLAVVLAFGPTFGYGFFVATAERDDPRSVPTVLRAIQKVDRYLVQPGLLVVLVAGIYLLSKA